MTSNKIHDSLWQPLLSALTRLGASSSSSSSKDAAVHSSASSSASGNLSNLSSTLFFSGHPSPLSSFFSSFPHARTSLPLPLSAHLQLALLPLILLLTALSLLFLYLLQRGLRNYLRVHLFQNDAYQHVPRPKEKFGVWTLLAGDMSSLRTYGGPGPFYTHWMRTLRTRVFAPRGLFYAPNLQIVDPLAMHHVLGSAHACDFPKPKASQRFLERMIGKGLVSVEGEVHRQQRRIISPAFSTTALRTQLPLFFKHGSRLLEQLGHMVDSTSGPSSTPTFPGQTQEGAQQSRAKQPVLDVSYWLSRTTLDVIGDAGFAEDFHTISHRPSSHPSDPGSHQPNGSQQQQKQDQQQQLQGTHELALAFKTMFHAASRASLPKFLVLFLGEMLQLGWLIRAFHAESRAIRHAYMTMRRLSLEIVARKRTEIRREMRENGLDATAGHGQGKGQGRGLTKAEYDESEGDKVDILHLLMRANMASDIKESERLDDEALLGQMTTMIFAGHETSESVLSWVLYHLSRNPTLQARLRTEVSELLTGREELSYEELNSMPLLEACIKEALRLNSPVFSTDRMSAKDAVIPLSKAYPTADGKGSFDKIFVKKGQAVNIPIALLNTDPDVWGADALEYNPDRWAQLPEKVTDGLLSFLAGPRVCIGQRFAMAEMKVLLASLVHTFRFNCVEGWEAEPKQAILMQFAIKGQEKHGIQMPLLISRV